MAIKTRVNKKTGKTEYKCRYYFMKDGKKRDSETGWFNTEAKAKKEAELLKKEKEREDSLQRIEKRDKKIESAFKEYLEYLKIKKEQEVSTNDSVVYGDASTLYRKHTPTFVLECRVKDIDTTLFRQWLEEINRKPLGGASVHHYKTAIIKFNYWLANNGYYTDRDLDISVELTLKRVKIKSTRVGNKELAGVRHIITHVELECLVQYYIKRGLHKFANFEYYTMFYVLFYSGMRVEELVALQWKFIDFRKHTISIKNTITVHETKEHILERVKNNDYRTKTRNSVRTIPIFDFYYELLEDYKYCYKYEFGLTDEEVEEGFVFPRIHKHNPFMYSSFRTLIGQLNYAIDSFNGDVPRTDLQMFRHSCAMFLILPAPNGLGFDYKQVIDYFGHTDEKMLRSVYARLNEMQKTDKMMETFSDLYTVDNSKETEDEALLAKMKDVMMKRIKGENEKYARKERAKREIVQIGIMEIRGKTQYYYPAKNQWIIEKYKELYPDSTMEFIQEG